MKKKIVFNGTEINVTDIYPYRYPDGKVVLRIKANEEDTDEATLKLLKSNTGDILYYEAQDIIPVVPEVPTVAEGEESEESTEAVEAVAETKTGEYVLKATYEDYTSGDYMSAYANGNYNVEIARISEADKKLTEMNAEIASNKEATNQNAADIEFVAMMCDVEI